MRRRPGAHPTERPAQDPTRAAGADGGGGIESFLKEIALAQLEDDSILRCEACGAENARDAETCRGCGRALESDDEDDDEEDADDASAATATEAGTKDDGGGKRGEWRGILVIGAVFSLVLAAWFLWNPPKPGQAPGASTPASNDTAPAVPKPDNEVKEIELAGDVVWVGTSKGLFAHDRKTGAVTQSIDAASGAPHDFIDSLLVDKGGALWAGGYGGGAGVFDGTKWTKFEPSTTGNQTVVQIFQDHAGIYWLATAGAGLFRFDGKTWTAYTRQNGLPSDEVNAIAEDADGALWLGTSDGVVRFADGKMKVYRPSDGLANSKVLAVAIDKQGVKWFGTWGSGISRFDGSSWRTFAALPEGPRSPFVVSARADGQGRVWFGTHDGVAMVDGATWTHYTSAEGLLGSDVYAIEIDADGNKWFGTYRGVSRLDSENQWKQFPH